MYNWESFKLNIQNNLIYYIECIDHYIIWTYIGKEKVCCKLYTSDLDNNIDFETNYKAKANKQVGDASAIFPINDGYCVRYKGVNLGTATAGQTTYLSTRINAERYSNGVQILLKNHVFGDCLDLEIVDVDNILGYGNNIVLDRFGDEWYVDPSTSLQSGTIVSYPGRISAGLYIRVTYYSVGTVDVQVLMNMLLHAKYQ